MPTANLTEICGVGAVVWWSHELSECENKRNSVRQARVSRAQTMPEGQSRTISAKLASSCLTSCSNTELPPKLSTMFKCMELAKHLQKDNTLQLAWVVNNWTPVDPDNIIAQHGDVYDTHNRYHCYALAEFKNFRLPDDATCTNTTKQMLWLSALSWGEGPRNASSGTQYGNW
ncbi:uncharacterized protein B0H18DRAFT_964204 [Fomitopsis serialis]|uniref:uncharacterized protein n=1 Tax=Fomitopsis serialis TaxID=139415 RepID=UPI00200734C1|nr:uncharacterized protein B0H18DRAFT_964204 [Neoantrodia serialis]KAH9908255.1 hypothetical protein B0H18DRAFT_964204 [Neoantrodia serialis]